MNLNMQMRFLVTLALVAGVFATNLLLPLYVWPASGAWDNVYEAIEANSQLTFQIIINPDSGPGGARPGDEYTARVTKLNSYSNVELYGYVHCNYNTDSDDGINRNVTEWNSWNADPKTKIDGIFYDEIPNEEDDGESVTFLASLVNAAISTFGAHPFKSIFNPGAIPQHVELFDLADYIVVFESEASAYSDAVLSNQIPSGKESQSSILVYDFADDGDKGQLEAWLQGMMFAGVGSANILSAGYDEPSSDDDAAGIATVASILSSDGDRSTAKPSNSTGFSSTSEGYPGGILSKPETVVNSVSVHTPETSSGGPSYDPHDEDGEDDEGYEQEEDGEDGNVQEDDDIPENY